MTPMQLCHSFYSCSSPICPLDPDKKLRVRYAKDDKCSLHPKTRRKYLKQVKQLA